ncbi:hypothetical protein TNCV_2327461 [Trichonephila clavipes]|nr:hypothetical protein TNCV_2327461 [Trichonephila clavipes]
MSPSSRTNEDPRVEGVESRWSGIEVEIMCQPRVRTRHLTDSLLRGPSPIALVLFHRATDVNKHSHTRGNMKAIENEPFHFEPRSREENGT